MNRAESALLAALAAACRGEKLPDPELTAEEWETLLVLAWEQETLPMVFDAVCACPSLQRLDAERRRTIQKKALELITRQVIQTNEFLTLIQTAQARGLDPVVLKGVTLRSLYPLPMLRPSVDEDLLVKPEEAETYRRFFLEMGLTEDDPEARELSFHKPESPTYIELHTELFPGDSRAYGDCGALFTGAPDRIVVQRTEDVELRTLSPTDHMLYLICHAYKHFLHGGAGLRHVCDMGMLSAHFGSEIDWPDILRRCESIRIHVFAAALLSLGERYLGFPTPESFSAPAADPDDMLADILSGGIYGNTDEDRVHSSTVTLEAVAARKEGRGARGLLSAAFPEARSLEGRYPFLRRRPWLAPAAWAMRLWDYARGGRAHPGASLHIAEARLRLLREYGIID